MIKTFRTHKDGRLRTHDLGPTIPTRSQTDLLDDHFSSEDLVAGDIRATEQPGLASLHSLFLNEHNRIATEMFEMNEGLNDEEIFQQAEIIYLGFNTKKFNDPSSTLSIFRIFKASKMFRLKIRVKFLVILEKENYL